jgi:hypothetical protein
MGWDGEFAANQPFGLPSPDVPEHDRVVELPPLFEIVDQLADQEVGLFGVTGEDLGHARKQLGRIASSGLDTSVESCRVTRPNRSGKRLLVK